MAASAAALIAGTLALWFGGEQFVLGMSRLAKRTRLPTILVGMVVAGFGTSTPELSVSVLARGRGDAALALGNALGSNVANVLLVLPVATLTVAWMVDGSLLRREVVAVLAATAFVVGSTLDGRITRPEASVLIIAFAGLLSWLAVAALRAPNRAAIEAEIEELVAPARRTVSLEAGRTAGGLAVLLTSAYALVWGGARLARELGIDEAVIGLTIVAVGTSLPEVVTGMVAARRGEPDIVLGNVLGSNLFNALLIVGTAGLVGPLTIDGSARTISLVGAGATALLLGAFLRPGFRVTRRLAVLGLAGYVAYVSLLYVFS